MIVKRIALALGSMGMVSMLAGSALAGAGPKPDHTHEHTHVPGPSVNVGAKAVGGNVSVVMGLDGFAGGNVGVSSGPDGLLIVDDMMPGFEHKLEDALSTLKSCVECGDLKYLINTHWHFDHAGNNEHFGGSSVLIAHETVRPLLMVEHNIEALNLKIAPKTRAGLPDITFAKKVSVFFNDEEIQVTHFPKSHTSGDAAVYFTKSNVLHLGDLYFNGMFPFVDVDTGGNVKGMIRSIEAVLADYPKDVKIIPGHGAVSDRAELATYLDMLKETTAVVEKAKASGKSLEDIQAAGLDKKWASWEWSFVNTKTWLSLIYKSL